MNDLIDRNAIMAEIESMLIEFEEPGAAEAVLRAIAEFPAGDILKLPPHKASLTIQHNDHKSCYQTVAGYIKDTPDMYDWPSEEEKQKANDTDELWTIQWYPETPGGFCAMAAATLETLLEVVSGEAS